MFALFFNTCVPHSPSVQFSLVVITLHTPAILSLLFLSTESVFLKLPHIGFVHWVGDHVSDQHKAVRKVIILPIFISLLSKWPPARLPRSWVRMPSGAYTYIVLLFVACHVPNVASYSPSQSILPNVYYNSKPGGSGPHWSVAPSRRISWYVMESFQDD